MGPEGAEGTPHKRSLNEARGAFSSAPAEHGSCLDMKELANHLVCKDGSVPESHEAS